MKFVAGSEEPAVVAVQHGSDVFYRTVRQKPFNHLFKTHSYHLELC